ncbi:LuxR family transcriptional regulator [Rhodococcus sp. RD6.2]|uniref:helix-turn-helix transcriptional regulator n=1 Tax=Rhodococcus sp. RD6.2 TaxID=260936 RepID=UPI00063B5A01|nr:LuxR C-terminal-related transcriptional regulator [Rhodococcus sp. RD6.2]CRK49281.1 LuxR family transcriptional regulator [Rhodococcus sp. RD6.2]
MPDRAEQDRLDALRGVLVGPLPDIGRRFSALVGQAVPHSALVIFTRECTGRPRKVAGDVRIVEKVTVAELDRLRTDLGPARADSSIRFRGTAVLGGREHPVHAILDRTDTLLVLVPRGKSDVDAELLADQFAIVALGIQLQVRHASPAYLAESRAASAERARTVAELTEAHAATLETILATLRSPDLDDTRARITARESATSALIGLRTAVDLHREMAEEAVTTAFARLRGELRALVPTGVVVEFVDPPVGGRGLPGEVAHAARAVVRGAVLGLVVQPDLRRVRVAWDCDGANLLIDVRDDGRGAVDLGELDRQVRPRIETLGGTYESESTPGWGSRLSATLPLDHTEAGEGRHALSVLGPREVEVLEHLVAGRRNRVIAERLQVSESTVKFHVAAVLRKLEVGTRGEAAALASEAGVKAAL